jgi:PTS system nitrogen regulatory IIA component
MKMSVKDAANILNVSEKTIYRWIKSGSIPYYRINEQIRFNRAELLEWATSQRVQISPDIFAEEEAGESAPPSLQEALKAGGIAYRVGGQDSASILRSIVDLLNLPEEVDRDYLYRVLMARESLGSTGVGEGIAIPHARNPVVLNVSRPTVTLCFLEHAIDFGAIDNLPVDTMFAIISPSVKAHLHLLSRLAFALRDAEFKEALRARADRERLMGIVGRVESAIPGAGSCK